jgi:hypothetical protein
LKVFLRMETPACTGQRKPYRYNAIASIVCRIGAACCGTSCAAGAELLTIFVIINFLATAAVLLGITSSQHNREPCLAAECMQLPAPEAAATVEIRRFCAALSRECRDFGKVCGALCSLCVTGARS